MVINNYIIHKLDKSMSEPTLSEVTGVLNADLDKYVQKLVKRVIKHDSLRKCKFNEYSENILKKSTDALLYGEDFIENSKEIANHLFEVMGISGDIDSGALMVVTFTEKEDTFVALLKLDYKEVYIQDIIMDGDSCEVQIGMHTETLSDKIKLGVIVGINGVNDDYHLKVLDVDAEKDGCDSNFVKEFVDGVKVVDDNFKTRVFLNKAESWITNAFSGEDIKKAEDMKSLLAYTLKEKDEVNIDKFMDAMDLDDESKESFKEHMGEEVVDGKFEVDKKWVDKKLKKRKVKMDNGFILNGDLADFEDPMKYSIRKNENGSTDIVIKNVNFIEG